MSAHCRHAKSVHHLKNYESKEKRYRTSVINVEKGKCYHGLFGQFYFGMYHQCCIH